MEKDLNGRYATGLQQCNEKVESEKRLERRIEKIKKLTKYIIFSTALVHAHPLDSTDSGSRTYDTSKEKTEDTSLIMTKELHARLCDSGLLEQNNCNQIITAFNDGEYWDFEGLICRLEVNTKNDVRAVLEDMDIEGNIYFPPEYVGPRPSNSPDCSLYNYDEGVDKSIYASRA